MSQPSLTPEKVLDERIRTLAAALKPAQESMHASWRESGLYYDEIDSLTAAAGRQSEPFIAATKIAAISIHIGRALDAIRASSTDPDYVQEVVHNLVDVLLGVLDAAEYLGADLGQQMVAQLGAATQHYVQGGRQPKAF
jgi:hypothetical protein